jgi:hypothetical protein
MEWIKIIAALIGVTLGWLLSESSKIFADKRHNKRKLKKLLFFLLELRFHFAKELSLKNDLSRYMDILKTKMTKKFNIDKNDTDIDIELNMWKPIVLQAISNTKNQDEKFEHLAENIDNIIIELAEIFPILAYKLSGKHNIKERLNNVDEYFNEVESLTGEFPFDIKEWINPKFTKELLEELDKSIKKIAKKTDAKTIKSSKNIIKNMTFDDDNEEMESFIDEYLEKVIQTMPIEH